jgi:hypothetical protein
MLSPDDHLIPVTDETTIQPRSSQPSSLLAPGSWHPHQTDLQNIPISSVDAAAPEIIILILILILIYQKRAHKRPSIFLAWPACLPNLFSPASAGACGGTTIRKMREERIPKQPPNC